MKTTFISAIAAIAMSAGAASVMAHHSFAAEFDASKPVKFTGTVTKIEWMNPHAYFYIDVKDTSGKVESWGHFVADLQRVSRPALTHQPVRAAHLETPALHLA